MNRPFRPFYKDVQLDDRIWWGKHKNKRVWQVIERDSQWIAWASETLDGFNLSQEAHDYLLMQEERPYGIDFKSVLRLCDNRKSMMEIFNCYREEVLASDTLKGIFKQRENELKQNGK